MRIAIDYDKTFSAAPQMWIEVVSTMRSYGHHVFLVTNRKADDPIPLKAKQHFSGTFYAGPKFKREHMEKLGIKIDIWIDDMPGTVERQRYLEDNLEEESRIDSVYAICAGHENRIAKLEMEARKHAD